MVQKRSGTPERAHQQKLKPLPLTLAQRVQFLRESHALSINELAQASFLTVDALEAIEGGIDTFLSVNTRQKLARALKVSPYTLQEVEKGNEKMPTLSVDAVEFIKESILSGMTHSLYCPRCGTELITSISIFEDLQGLAVKHPKAQCRQCVFQVM